MLSHYRLGDWKGIWPVNIFLLQEFPKNFTFEHSGLTWSNSGKFFSIK